MRVLYRNQAKHVTFSFFSLKPPSQMKLLTSWSQLLGSKLPSDFALVFSILALKTEICVLILQMSESERKLHLFLLKKTKENPETRQREREIYCKLKQWRFASQRYLSLLQQSSCLANYTHRYCMHNCIGSEWANACYDWKGTFNWPCRREATSHLVD